MREAVATLASLGPDGKVLAGGQSLLPMLSMRLAAPHHLVDINRLAELDYVRVGDGRGAGRGAGPARPGAGRRRRAQAAQPLLAQALRLVAHATIRNRGTTVGSIVHADPSGEMTAVLALLGGSVRVAGSSAVSGEVAAGRLLPRPARIGCGTGGAGRSRRAFPVLPPGAGTAFVEVARRHGDYAVCGVAALVELDDAGAVRARARAPTSRSRPRRWCST